MEITYRGIKVSVGEDGIFQANPADDIEYRTASLAEMKKNLDRFINSRPKAPLGIKVVAIQQPGRGQKRKVVALEVAGINRTTRDLQFTIKADNSWCVVPDTPGNRLLLAEYAAAQDLAEALQGKVLKRIVGKLGHGRVDIEEYENLVNSFRDSYDEALAIEEEPSAAASRS